MLMKKLFLMTLALVLMAMSAMTASAQKKAGVKPAKSPQVGWVNLITNGDMEGDDNSCFFTKVNYGEKADSVLNSEIQAGVGYGNTRGIKVVTGDRPEETGTAWDNQFWFRFTESVPAGTKYRVSFDYRADEDATIGTQAHEEPGNYIFYEMLGNIDFYADWTTFEKEGEVTSSQSTDAKAFQSIAFNLNDDSHPGANAYYFDNIVFEIYRVGTEAKFKSDVILIDFGFKTNIPELVKATGKPRLMYPKDCVQLTVDGDALTAEDITSVEAFADGRFYIFLENMLDDDSEVSLKIFNPADAAHRIIYTSGADEGKAVEDFDGAASYDDDADMAEDAYAYIYEKPIILESDPEDGSFNLPLSLKEYTITFDKPVECAAIVATLDGKKLSVTPATGYAESIVLKRDGAGDMVKGEHTIKIDKVYPEARLSDDIYSTFEYSFYVGKIEAGDDVPKDILPIENFTNCAVGGIPEGWYVNFNGDGRTSESTYGSGPRMFQFPEGGDFTKALYFREGYAQYGDQENFYLELEAGKTYVIRFNSSMWKYNGSQMTFSIMSPDGEETYFTETINNTPNVNGNTSAAVTGSTASEFTFVPEASGYYMLRWTREGFNEVLLANVLVKYMPNVYGVEVITLLNTAIDNAKAAMEANGDARYLGPDYTALQDAVAKYEAEKDGYTAPSKFKAAAADLDAKTAALKDHRTLCDTYDTQIKKSLDVERRNAENKFANTKLYADVVAVNAKYHGSSEWRNVSDDPEVEDNQLFYTYDILTNNDSLTVAVTELNAVADQATLLFTEGVSAPENANGGKGTGYAVFFDRMRLGLATLNTLAETLNVTLDSTYIAGLNRALIDDDDLVNGLKLHIKNLAYKGMADASNPLFQVTVDDQTSEEVTPIYDMTVFVKNHNVYKQHAGLAFNADNVPGWVTPEGSSAPGLTVGWGHTGENDDIPVDCMFQTWGGAYRVQQTITDLPAGIYTIRFGFGDRDNQEIEESYSFAITSDEVENYGGCPGIGQAFPFATNDSQASIIEDVVVTDGQLTIGVNAGQGSHTFFNDVRLLLTSPAGGFNYADEYAKLNGDIETGVEAPAAARVRGIELYDLNGRRIFSAQKGVQIVKKYMSDGTVRIEKVIKK